MTYNVFGETLSLIQSVNHSVQVHRSSFHEVADQSCESKDGKPTDGIAGCGPAAEDNIETSVFYQSMMSWKNLQDWAQRVWAKHYQQSPIGSTQNVTPVIVQGGLGTEYISSVNSPSDQNALANEAETNFGYHDNLQPTNQHAALIGQKSAPANEATNVSAQLATRGSFPASQSEMSNVAAGRGSGHVCCHGDAVNKLNLRNQLDVQSPIERDVQAAARHRERLAMQTANKSKKSRCMFTDSLCLHYVVNCRKIISDVVCYCGPWWSSMTNVQFLDLVLALKVQFLIMASESLVVCSV